MLRLLRSGTRSAWCSDQVGTPTWAGHSRRRSGRRPTRPELARHSPLDGRGRGELVRLRRCHPGRGAGSWDTSGGECRSGRSTPTNIPRRRHGPPTACSTRPRRRRRCGCRGGTGGLASSSCFRTSRMPSLLVTGGAGFIGANFVHHWLHTHPGDRVVVLDALTYAGNSASLEPVAQPSRASRSSTATSARRSWRVAAPRARDHDDRAPRGRVACGPLDRGPDAFIETNVVGTHALAQGGPHGLARRRVGAAGERGSTTSPPTRCTARSVPTIAPFREDTPYAPELALRGEQGGLRPPGARLSPHLRAAGHHQQLLQQLRPLPVPREADPAHAGERAGRQAAAGLRRRRERARLALRGGPLPGARAGRARGDGSERPTTSAAGTSGANLDLVRLLCRLVDEAFAADPSCARRFPRSARRARREVRRRSSPS